MKRKYFIAATICMLIATNMFSAYKYVSLKKAYHKAEAEKQDLCIKWHQAMCELQNK